MKTKFGFILVLVVLLAVNLSACNRPASEGPAATPTEVFPFPLPTQGVSQFATQTAAARLPAVVTATSQPGATQLAKTQGVLPTNAAGTSVVQTTEKPVDKPTVKPSVIPTLSRPESYTIQQGEFPYCIARRFNLSVADLLNLNGLSTDTKPAVGFALRIPQSGTWQQGNRWLIAHPDTVIVQVNESIGSIACKYGDVSPEAILAANGLKNADEIQVGQKLQIP